MFKASKVDAVKRGSEPFRRMRGLAMRFTGILRGKNPDTLDEWIDEAIDIELPH